MLKTKTDRGFDSIQFTDLNGEQCVLEKSSLATDDAVFIGINDANPKILGETSWMPYQMPENVVVATRMHLTRDQVKQLLPALQAFVDTGHLS